MDSVKHQGFIPTADTHQSSLDKLIKTTPIVLVEKSLSRSKSLSAISDSNHSGASTKIPSFASPKNSDISTLSEFSNIAINDVSRPHCYSDADIEKIKTATARINEAEAGIKKSYDAFVTTIETIKQEKVSAIGRATFRASITQSYTPPMSSGERPSFKDPLTQGKENSEIQAIEVKAERETKIAFLNFQKKISEHQKSIASSILEKRTLREKTQKDEDNPLFTESLPICYEQASHIEAEALALVRNPVKASDGDLSLAQQALTAANYLRHIALADGADDDISDASVELERIDQSLALLSDRDLPAESRFSSQTVITKNQETLAKHRANFLLEQTKSDKAAGLVAKNIVTDLLQQVDALRTKVTKCQKERRYATDGDKAKLMHQESTLKELSTALESAALAYDQIADACCVEIRSIIGMEKDFLALRAEIATNASTHASQKPIVAALDSVKIDRPGSEIDEGNTFDLSIFSELDEISESYQEHAISGSKGKIILTSPRSDRLSEADRRNYNNAINLIKLAIFRDFGIYGVKRFEDHFEAKITARNPLHLDELREFISLENTAHPRSCFISSQQPLKEIISAENSTSDTRVIKSDDYDASTFNPFSNNLVSESATTNEAEATKRGIEMTRKALKEFFEEIGSSDSQIEVIINDFNQKFTDKGENAPLTIAALRSFITEHDDVGLFSNLLLAYNRNRLRFAVFTAFMSAVKTTPLLLHAGLLAPFLLVVVTQAINDWTAEFRRPSR